MKIRISQLRALIHEQLSRMSEASENMSLSKAAGFILSAAQLSVSGMSPTSSDKQIIKIAARAITQRAKLSQTAKGIIELNVAEILAGKSIDRDDQADLQRILGKLRLAESATTEDQ